MLEYRKRFFFTVGKFMRSFFSFFYQFPHSETQYGEISFTHDSKDRSIKNFLITSYLDCTDEFAHGKGKEGKTNAARVGPQTRAWTPVFAYCFNYACGSAFENRALMKFGLFGPRFVQPNVLDIYVLSALRDVRTMNGDSVRVTYGFLSFIEPIITR